MFIRIHIGSILIGICPTPVVHRLRSLVRNSDIRVWCICILNMHLAIELLKMCSL